MKRYLVTLEGSAFEIPGEGEPIRGFFVTRAVRAESEAEAAKAAIAKVATEWEFGARKHFGVRPQLTVDGLRPVTFLEAWRLGHGGYIFHPGE